MFLLVACGFLMEYFFPSSLISSNKLITGKDIIIFVDLIFNGYFEGLV